MRRIVIIEEKADKMISKLEKVKSCIEEVIDCFSECMEGSDDYQPVGYNQMRSAYKSQYPTNSNDDDWDDEYEVKRRRGNRRYDMKIMRPYEDSRMSRY